MSIYYPLALNFTINDRNIEENTETQKKRKSIIQHLFIRNENPYPLFIPFFRTSLEDNCLVKEEREKKGFKCCRKWKIENNRDWDEENEVKEVKKENFKRTYVHIQRNRLSFTN